MDLSHLGAPLGPMVRVHGGFANRMYRLDTDQGSFAVKELSRAAYRARDVFRFERAAFAAGIPMPEPISAGHDTLAHRWVDGEKSPEEPVSAAYAFEILRCLAGAEAATGPDLALSHESARNGVRGLPELFRRLPELRTLLG